VAYNRIKTVRCYAAEMAKSPKTCIFPSNSRYIIGEEMWCDDDQSAINFASLNTKLYGAKECLLCEDRLLSKTGTVFHLRIYEVVVW